MSVARAVYLLALFAGLSVGVIAMRSEQARAASSIGMMQRELVALRREKWSLESELSRMRSPQHVRERVERWSLALEAPGTEQVDSSSERLAFAR